MAPSCMNWSSKASQTPTRKGFPRCLAWHRDVNPRAVARLARNGNGRTILVRRMLSLTNYAQKHLHECLEVSTTHRRRAPLVFAGSSGAISRSAQRNVAC